jgi:hypothetical protein
MFESEIVLGLLIVAWIGYELYGRQALEWLSAWAAYIRIGGGIAVIGYLWWVFRDDPDATKTGLEFAKQLLKDGSSSYMSDWKAGGSSSTTREKRNVTGLMKKRVAASQQWKCGSCSKTLDETYEVDHRLALFNGGTNDKDNLVALCPHCHRLKSVEERLATST